MPTSRKLTPYWVSECGRTVVHVGDCREVMARMEPDQFHAVVTDPPYGLEFMGKEWDAPWKQDRSARQRHAADGMSDTRAYQAWFLDRAEQMLRVALPGAHLLSFGGTRMWHRMTCAVEDAGWEIRDTIMWLYGGGFPKSHDISKAIDRMLGAERGRVKFVQSISWRETEGREDRQETIPDSQPVTDAARRWQGWGTALKPSHEDLVLARKPLSGGQEQVIIVENLSVLEAQLWSLLPASAAERYFGLSRSEYDAVCASARWSAGERSSIQADLSAVTDTLQFESAVSSCLNTVMSWRNILSEDCALKSTSITETGSSTTIDWKTLRSCSSALTPRTIIQAAINQPGSWWNASGAARVLNAVALNLQTTRDLSALASAIDGGHMSRLEEGGYNLRPAYEPVLLARRPVYGTVAECVLDHGTGGLNVGGCSVGRDQMRVTTSDGNVVSENNSMAGPNTGRIDLGTKTGRWPANVLHDGSDEVVELFPSQAGGGGANRERVPAVRSGGALNFNTGGSVFANGVGHGDSGSAARFFYTAKADEGDRPHGKGATVHPTVKPLDLMRYLVRLVCVLGGTVLDPFMGSGSTGCAAVAEGMRFVGIEQSREYADLAVGRLRLALQTAPTCMWEPTGALTVSEVDVPPPPKKLR